MNSNNNMVTCLPPPSTDEANSNGRNPLCLQPGSTRPQSDLPDAKKSRAATQRVLRVLLLEDNVELAELLRLMFEMWGFQPTVAHLGREASRLLEEEEFHLAVVDIDLPDTTGFEVVAGAVARGWLQNTKIIFFSGHPSDDRVAMARQFPGSLFVAKPFEMRNLMALIRKLFTNESMLAAERSVYE
jgi:DNA-binding response OmpR family regulator